MITRNMKARGIAAETDDTLERLIKQLQNGEDLLIPEPSDAVRLALKAVDTFFNRAAFNKCRVKPRKFYMDSGIGYGGSSGCNNELERGIHNAAEKQMILDYEVILLFNFLMNSLDRCNSAYYAECVVDVMKSVQESLLFDQLSCLVREISALDLEQKIQLLNSILDLCLSLANFGIFETCNQDLLKKPSGLLHSLQDAMDTLSILSEDQSVRKVGRVLRSMTRHLKNEETVDRNLTDEVSHFLQSSQLQFTSLYKTTTSHHLTAKTIAYSQTYTNSLKRIKIELSILRKGLPPGIFVKVDESDLSQMKVLIIGPMSTPYENGCFLFDLEIPPNFPSVPPKMEFKTTGNQFRFNPNLYSSGKICLSLLGTWQGPGWDENHSTLLQLLVSLQALVLCDSPLDNEPGYEGKGKTMQGLVYDKWVRRGTCVYAMLWHLRGNAGVFDTIIRAHLYSQREQIMRMIRSWEDEDHMRTGQCSYFHPNGTEIHDLGWEEQKEQLKLALLQLECPRLEHH